MTRIFCIGELLIDFVAENQGNNLSKAMNFTKKASYRWRSSWLFYINDVLLIPQDQRQPKVCEVTHCVVVDLKFPAQRKLNSQNFSARIFFLAPSLFPRKCTRINIAWACFGGRFSRFRQSQKYGRYLMEWQPVINQISFKCPIHLSVKVLVIWIDRHEHLIGCMHVCMYVMQYILRISRVVDLVPG